MSESVVAARTTASRIAPTLRAVLLSPESGFAAAIKAANRRAQSGRRPIEGAAPRVIAGLGFGALCLLWLKLGSLLQLRQVAAADFRWDYLVASVLLAALLGLGLQWLWGIAGGGLMRLLEVEARPARPILRLVWGLALFPQVLALALLLPLDLLIVGPETFTSERLVDPLAKLWAALSMAGGSFLAAWSLWLLYKGLVAASSNHGVRTAAVVVAAVGLTSLIVATLGLGSRALSGGLG